MAVRTIETYDFGDMRVRYLLDEDTGIPEMMLYPQGREPWAGSPRYRIQTVWYS